MRFFRSVNSDHISRAVYVTLLGLTMVVLACPMIVAVIVSLSNGNSIELPPNPWGFGAYEKIFADSTWPNAFKQSLQIAVPAALIATALGVVTSVSLFRSRMPLTSFWQGLGILPLIIPVVAYATAVFVLYANLKLVGNYWGLVAINVVHALPVVLVLCGTAVSRVPIQYDLVAMSLGASRGRALVGITLRLMLAPVCAAFVLAFLLAFGEATFIVFVGGTDWNTLPRTVYGSLQSGVSPTVAAVSTLLMLISAALVLVASRFESFLSKKSELGYAESES